MEYFIELINYEEYKEAFVLCLFLGGLSSVPIYSIEVFVLCSRPGEYAGRRLRSIEFTGFVRNQSIMKIEYFNVKMGFDICHRPFFYSIWSSSDGTYCAIS